MVGQCKNYFPGHVCNCIMFQLATIKYAWHDHNTSWYGIFNPVKVRSRIRIQILISIKENCIPTLLVPTQTKLNPCSNKSEIFKRKKKGQTVYKTATEMQPDLESKYTETSTPADTGKQKHRLKKYK